MKINFYILIKILIITTFSSKTLQSKNLGDLTKQEPIEMNIQLSGKIGKIHFFSPNVLIFKTGKLYKLKIINTSKSKHYFSSSNFSKSIFTRKIQINKNDEKVAEVKGNISEIEVFPNNVVEWWFVPIKTGQFDDLLCSVKDLQANKKHSEMGMVGKIIIE